MFKKRLLVILIAGVSFGPAVFASEAEDVALAGRAPASAGTSEPHIFGRPPVRERAAGEMRVSDLNGQALVCDENDRKSRVSFEGERRPAPAAPRPGTAGRGA